MAQLLVFATKYKLNVYSNSDNDFTKKGKNSLYRVGVMTSWIKPFVSQSFQDPSSIPVTSVNRQMPLLHIYNPSIPTGR